MSEEQLINTPCVFGENGNFLLERELGRGGMGGVYMGRDKMLDRPVAVKVMLKEYGSDPDFVEKFKKEAQAAARLIHPNIAQVYSYGIAEGMPYIAMELVAGGSLDQVMQNSGGKTDVARVMKICEQVAQALRCAADQGLVHGDIKPENVLLDSNGNAKLVDFGLAAMQKDTNEIWGTPYYIAPEKVKKEPIDYRADMYSLGGTIYHALTGVAPFEGDNAVAVVRKRFERMPKKPSEVRSGISPQIDFLVMKMLAFNPAERYPSFESLLEDFKKVMTTGLSTTTTLSTTGVIPDGGTPGARKYVFKTKHRFTTAKHDDSEVADLKDYDGKESKPARGTSDRGDDDDDGGVGGKVAKALGIAGAAVALVAAGLFWYMASQKAKEYREREAGIQKRFSEARNSLAKSREAVEKHIQTYKKNVSEASAAAEGFTQEVEKLLAENNYDKSVIEKLRPEPSVDLRNAASFVASTNDAAKAFVESSFSEEFVKAGGALESVIKDISKKALARGAASRIEDSPDKQQAKPQGKKKKGGPPPFRKPKGDETDPASPAGRKYLKEKKDWDAGGWKKASGKAPAAASASAPAAPSGAKRTDTPEVVGNITSLWEKVHSCAAAAIRQGVEAAGIVADIAAAEKVTLPEGEDELSQKARSAAADKVVAAANGIVTRVTALKGATIFQESQSARNYICGGSGSKGGAGARAVQTAKDEFYRQKRDQERKAQEELERKEREARERRLREEKERLVKEEVAAAKAAFDEIIASGKIRQLDWKGADRIINTLRPTQAEGQIEQKKQLEKIECMKRMHEALIEGLKDYTFISRPDMRLPQKENLAGAKVVKVDEKTIVVRKKGAQRNTEISWQSFCSDYLTSLAEVIGKFIVKGGGEGDANKGLRGTKRFEALVGVAFIMEYVCSEKVGTARDNARVMLFEAAKLWSDKIPMLKECFPGISFDEVESQISSEKLW